MTKKPWWKVDDPDPYLSGSFAEERDEEDKPRADLWPRSEDDDGQEDDE